MAENLASNQTVAATVQNVVNTALRWGAAYVLFWETFDNECSGGVGEFTLDFKIHSLKYKIHRFPQPKLSSRGDF